MADIQSKKKAGRPAITEVEADRMRRRIVAEARALFAEQGAEGVSMRKIAERAGFSQRLPYRYFDNKLQIIRYLWEEFFEELFALCDESIAQTHGARDRLVTFATTYARYWHDHPEQFELVFMVRDQIAAPDDDLYVNKSGVIGHYGRFEDLIAACMGEGVLVGDDPQALAQLLVANLHGVLSLTIGVSEVPWMAFEPFLDRTLSTFIKGNAQP